MKSFDALGGVECIKRVVDRYLLLCLWRALIAAVFCSIWCREFSCLIFLINYLHDLPSVYYTSLHTTIMHHEALVEAR